MRINGKLSIEEWQEPAVGIGGLATSIAFIVGDWLVYGQGLFGTEGSPDKKSGPSDLSTRPQGHRPRPLDAPELCLCQPQRPVFVARRTPFMRTPAAGKTPGQRNQKLDRYLRGRGCGGPPDVHPPPAQVALPLAGRHRGRHEPDPADRGVENHIPFVNWLALWWRHTQEKRFLAGANYEQRQALKRDLEPVVNIYNQL